MSNFPINIDDDTTLPPVNNNLTEIGAEAINSVRDAIFNIETEIGLGGSGSTNSIADRIGISLDLDGTIRPSAISGLGLVTLPITQDQIIDNAQIPESKLKLVHKTQDLFNYNKSLAQSVNSALGWISLSGIKIEPHLMGALYRHTLDQIDVSSDSGDFLNNKFDVERDNSSSLSALIDLNNELVKHQKLDGTAVSVSPYLNVEGYSGTTFPSDYAHPASGIHLDVDNFTFIPQTVTDIQKLADFINTSNKLIVGSRNQTLFSNGISRTARSSSLILDSDGFNDTVGQAIVPYTSAKTYLSNVSPNDDISDGDDLIEFTPTGDGYLFYSKFILVNIGDIVTVKYENINGNSITLSYVVKEKKINIDSLGNKLFFVRTNNHNIYGSDYAAVARIDKPLFNTNKYGVLALAKAQLNSSTFLPSLIAGNPRGAVALGINFNPNAITASNYKLYLQFYPNGNPADAAINLPGIDITGNAGSKPGSYTLDNIVDATNIQFRKPGANYRFIAFQYQGQFGIMLADSYNNASFAILDGVDNSYSSNYSNNVINSRFGSFDIDPLGLGPTNANLSSPPYTNTFTTASNAANPTKIIVPLKRNNYYVNGSESEAFIDGYEKNKDQFNDGYWFATIDSIPTFTSHASIVYKINLDLSSSNLQIGKTLVVQPTDNNFSSYLNYGRFIISDVDYVAACGGNGPCTLITVFDGVHGLASATASTATVGSSVRIYFNDDSIGFNGENVSDINLVSPFKRYFESYIDGAGHSFNYERARFSISGNLILNNDPSFTLNSQPNINKINIVHISPKLNGYKYGNYSKIILTIISYSSSTGLFTGYITNGTISGPIVSGKKGQITRFYDKSNIDYIEIIFDITDSISDFSSENLDIQLYSSLNLDDEFMLLGSCQLNDSTKEIKYLKDLRQFGNVSEKNFSTSAINFINSSDKFLHQNGIIKGFDIASIAYQITINGGTALVNGKIINMNDTILKIPLIQDTSNTYPRINWALCVNDKSEFELIPLTDYDSSSPATPINAIRIFTAYNPVTSTSYNIDAVRFVDIIDNRKDLTILHIVTANVNNSGAFAALLTSKDARKYIYNSDAIIYPVLGDSISQSNFTSFDSMAIWLKNNSDKYTNIGVKSSFTITNSNGVNNPIYNFGSENGYVIKFNGNNINSFTFGSGNIINFYNCHFNELPIIIDAGIVGFTNCIFDPTSVTINGGNAFFDNCTFDNCTLTLNGGVFSNLSNFGNKITLFRNSNIILNKNMSLTSPAKFENTVITKTGAAKGFNINSNDISFNKCHFTDGYNAASNVGYVSANKINLNGGVIYCDVSLMTDSYLNNLNVSECKFTTELQDHYPFINIVFSGTSTASNINIEKNIFNTTNVSDSTKCVCVIASTDFDNFQIITNCNINENYCNKNQLIAACSNLNSDDPSAQKRGLTFINSFISNNISGLIGISNENLNLENNCLNVLNNKTNAIYSCNNIGELATDLGSPTKGRAGNLVINNNKVSNIILSIFNKDSSNIRNFIKLDGNHFVPNNFISTINSIDGYAHIALSVKQPTYIANNFIQSIITNNTFDRSSLSDATYYYSIFVDSDLNSEISNNTFRNPPDGPTTTKMLKLGPATGGSEHKFIITNNDFVRDGDIASFIEINGGNGIITDNFFSDTTVDGTNETLVVFNNSAQAVYERNINQTFFTYLSLYTEKFIPNSVETVIREIEPDFSNIGISIGDETNAAIICNLYIDLSNKLPKGVTIKHIKIGSCSPLDGPGIDVSGTPDNKIRLIYKSNIGSDCMDIRNTYINDNNYSVYDEFTINDVSSRTNFTNNTQYVTTIPVSNNVAKSNINISCEIYVKVNFSAAGNDILISPLEIKYRW